MKTSTKNVIIGCVLTAFFSIILSILGTNEYNNSKQTQEQNQSIVVNINGQKVNLQQEDVEELNNKISKLEIENDELNSINTNLTEQLNNKGSVPDITLNDYKLFINGIEQSIVNKDSLIKYNNNFYIRNDLILLINNNVKVDEQNNKIVIGKDFGQTVCLMNACPPYEKSGHLFSTDPFIMQGEQYMNGFQMASPGKYYVLFNLKNTYSFLEFDFGHIDNTGNHDCVVSFYIDDVLVKTLTKGYQEDITHETISLNYGKRLKIEINTGIAGDYAYYGFANAILVY